MMDFICASCESNLATTGFANGWRIKIENEAIPSVASAAVTDMWVEPPLHGKSFFCGLGCLKSWVDKQLNTRNGKYERGKKY